MSIESRHFPILGWREWVCFPELDVPPIECKVDTGARTSALHAFYVEAFEEDGVEKVRFGLHPHQGDTETEVHCVAEVHDKRVVTDSGGHQENRYVILTKLVLGNETWPIEVTLTNRDSMRFRMLLGRTAIADNYVVDPGAQHLMGQPSENPNERSILSRRHDEEEE